MTVGRVLLEVQRFEVDQVAGRVRAAGEDLRGPGAELVEALAAAARVAAGVGSPLACAAALAECSRLLASGVDEVTAAAGLVADRTVDSAAALDAADQEVARGSAGPR